MCVCVRVCVCIYVCVICACKHIRTSIRALSHTYTQLSHSLFSLSRHETVAVRPPISQIIQVKQTRHARHCWRSKDEIINDIL